MMNFEELNDATRERMVWEFRTEQSSLQPFVPSNLTAAGGLAFGPAMEQALRHGDEEVFIGSFLDPAYWLEDELRTSKTGKVFTYHLPAGDRARRLGLTEFNTWYIRGLARLLLDEGVQRCEVYRAETAYQPRGECLALEGETLSVQQVYDGHRAKYHPMPDRSAFSLPTGPNCHHSIRRLKG
jgi:hypothetical protein